MSRRLSWYLVLMLTVPAFAQRLVNLGDFTSFEKTYEDTVEFLPGPVIIVHNDIRDGKTNIYQYRSGRFAKARTPLPPQLMHWSSFNWRNVDFPNQIDRSDFEDDAITGFLPAGAKTKALAMIPGKKTTLVLVCYAIVPGHEWDLGNQRDLRLLMLKRGPLTRDTRYKKLADINAAEEAYFGGLFVERQSAGTFVVLYWSTGIGHVTNSATVFMLAATK